MDGTIIFGLGGKYRYERQTRPSLFEGLDIIAYSDNDSKLWGKNETGKPIVSPEEAARLNAEEYIVISNYYKEISLQLLDMGIPNEKIIHWDNYVIKNNHTKKIYTSNNIKSEKRKVLLISTNLNYNGGTIALINAGKALSNLEYNVTICGPSANEDIIEFILSKDINVIIAPAIAYPDDRELDWIQSYDYIVVNVFQMIEAAWFISKYKPILWWIHESGEKYSELYPLNRSIHYKCEIEKCKNLLVCPVSKRAEKVFLKYYPTVSTRVLTLGLEDFYKKEKIVDNERKKRVAILGSIIKLKNQLFVLKTLEEYGEKLELYLVGTYYDSEYGKLVKNQADKMSNVTFINETNYSDIHNIYNQMDIILCSSLEETLSMTIIEGMMNRKICITSDAAGVSDYILDGVNGFVYESNNEADLRDKIDWILSNENRLEKIRNKARETYLKEFSLERVGKEFEVALKEIYG